LSHYATPPPHFFAAFRRDIAISPLIFHFADDSCRQLFDAFFRWLIRAADYTIFITPCRLLPCRCRAECRLSR